jgi:hypothetical protein
VTNLRNLWIKLVCSVSYFANQTKLAQLFNDKNFDSAAKRFIQSRFLVDNKRIYTSCVGLCMFVWFGGKLNHE